MKSKTVVKRIIYFTLAIIIALPVISCTFAPNKDTAKELYDNAMADGKLTVILDSGHGLSDVGALNEENLGNVTEADINLAITKLVSEKLSDEGYTVILTHDGVTQPTVEYDDGKASFGPTERSEYANSTDGDIFISFHCDSFPKNPDVYGTRVYYPVETPNSSPADKRLAESAASEIDNAFANAKKVVLKPMKGQDCYTVLYKTKVPSILIEMGFITNKEDAERLTDADWQNSFATAVAKTVDTYFGK